MLFNLNLNLFISKGDHRVWGRTALSGFIALAGIACEIAMLPIRFT